jgi:deferrochelatase/peroxidase EfeB
MTLSRRALLGMTGAAGLATAAGAVGALEATQSEASSEIPFFGRHQAGITTPQQDRLHLAALDLTTDNRADVVALLREWTDTAARLTAGRDIGSGAAPAVSAAPPDDTGEAQGLQASRLTVTVGFGGSLLDSLDLSRPPALADLPAFAGDALDPARSDGDLVVQACADDPQVAVHAVRNLVRLAHGTAAVRWSQLGFGRTSSTTPAQQTPRNLFGFKDGTVNDVRDIWVQPTDGPTWMVGGSYLVVRRIAMAIETWDRTSLAEQEQLIGRHKGSGAPLGKQQERDALVPSALPVGSHVREAHPDVNGGAQMLRRGYSFVDGSDGLGHLDAGLCFLAYQRDPRTGFIPVQQRLSRVDAMNEYIRHTGSALFAIPPGVRPGGYFGQDLLGSARRS